MSAFDFLTCMVRINAHAPEEWRDEGELPFWTEPNRPEYDPKLIRVLYHESVHFWQLLSSGYLANLLAEEWVRLLHFEQSGELRSISDNVRQFSEVDTSRPFVNQELMESWARYWDVHTRSPAVLMKDEGIEPEKPGIWEIDPPGSTAPIISYTGDAFDLVMQVGPDCEVYGRPYRWLLDRYEKHSAFVAILFPLLTHAAFGSPDPVRLFCHAFDRAWESKELRNQLDQRTGSINLDWINLWPVVMEHAVVPTLMELTFPVYTSGLDVISRGHLRTHPILPEYLLKTRVRGFLKLYQALPRGNGAHDLLEAEALQKAPEFDPMIPFAMPGQPFYRRALGFMVPPPCIQFENFTWSARRPVELKIEAAQKGKKFDDTFDGVSTDLERRCQRFRAAEKAVALGLPIDAFEH